jgi:transcriptional regulator with XRE-family HTH domain
MLDAEIYAKLGALVRSHRERLGKTQADVAEGTGLSRASIANIETGRQRILLHQLYSLAVSLEVEPYTLLPLAEKSRPRRDKPTLRSSIALSKKEKEEVTRLIDSLAPINSVKDS